MKIMRDLLAMALVGLVVTSCSNDIQGHSPVDECVWHTATMVMNVSKAGFDGTTKSAASWQNGDVVYLLFSKESGKVQGKAVYQASSANWTVEYYGSLQHDAEAQVSLWYFENAGAAAADSVVLTSTTGIYSDKEGKYTFPTDGKLVVTGNLAPATSRIRFKGNAGMKITVKGIRHNTKYCLSEGTISFSDEPISLEVQNDGYTSFLFCTFTDSDARTMTITNSDGIFTASCPSNVLQTGKTGRMEIPTADSHNGWTMKDDPFNGHEYVDLGLTSGTLWATCNVGATKPEEYGDYFAWGETTGYNSGKTNFDWSTYKWCKGSYTTMTKYCTNSSYGTVDNKKELELSDDAARANWGGQWRMPSSAQIDELISECNTEWTTQNSVYGRKVTSKKNGKSIFLPAAGYRRGSSLYNAGSYGYYWSRSLYESDGYYAYYLDFFSNNFCRVSRSRFYGQSVRPVVSE